jgi:F-type H+-transporting ATPase subunit delta|tara:strand:+ start:2051 stop:2593 length:543 start_codon:yes stop_codon:yes gene_type:complete
MAEAELTTIARPYAKAAFSFALDQDQGLTHWSAMLGILAAAMAEDVVREKLDDPKLTTEAGAEVLVAMLDGELDDKAGNFLIVLAENGRLALLPNISEIFELLKAEYEKTINVEVTSAYEVSSEETEKLSDALHKKLQREVNLTTHVDESLLGGVVIKAEDSVIDGSVRGKLRKLSQALQ